MALKLSAQLQAMKPANVEHVKEWIGPPLYRGSRTCVRLARLADGQHVWATWGGDDGEPSHYWGPVNPGDCGAGHKTAWRHVTPGGRYCARLGHVLTLSVSDSSSLPSSPFVTRDVRPSPGGERFATVWAHCAHRIVGPATDADAFERRDADTMRI